MPFLIPSRPKKVQRKKHNTYALKFSSLIRDYTPKSQPIAEVLQHHYLGRRGTNGNVIALVKGQLRNVKEIEELLLSCKESSVLFRPGGLFTVIVECPFGEGYIPDLRAKLRQLIRLTLLLQSLKRRQYAPPTINLNAITFPYSSMDSPTTSEHTSLSCTISIPNAHTQPLNLELDPLTSNPHSRIRSFLEDSLNRSPDVFCRALKLTLPGMRALSRLEAHGAGSVRTRSLEHYRIAYTQVPTVFNISIGKRRDVPELQISELPPPGSSANLTKAQMDVLLSVRPKGYQEAIKQLFSSEGEGYKGRNNLISCTPEGLEKAIDQLDATVRQALPNTSQQRSIAGSQAAASASTAKPEQQPSQQRPPPQQSSAGNTQRPQQQNRGPGPGAQVITLD